MRNALIAVVLAASLAAACSDGPDDDVVEEAVNPNRPQIIEELPVVPGAILRDTTGTAESERREYFVGASLDSVSRFYRGSLTAAGWREVNFLGDSTVFDLHMQKDSQSLWIHANPGGPQFRNLTIFTVLASGAIAPGTPVADTLPRRRGDPRPR